MVVEEAELESLEAALDLAQVGHSKESYHLSCPGLKGCVYRGEPSSQGQQLLRPCGRGAGYAPVGAPYPSPPEHGGDGQEGQRGLPGLQGEEPSREETAWGVRGCGGDGGSFLFFGNKFPPSDLCVRNL